MKVKFVIIGASLGIVVVFLILLSQFKTTPTTRLGTTIGGKDYGQITRNQIFTRLNQDFILPVNLRLRSGSFQTSLSTASISASLNFSATTSRLLPPVQINFIEWLKSKIISASPSVNYQLVISTSDSGFSDYFSTLTTQLEKPYIPTELQVKDNQITSKKGELGQKINTNTLKNQIMAALSSWQIDQTIEIPIDSIGALPSEDQILATINRAKTILGKNIVLTAEDKIVNVDDVTLISWLGFDNDLLDEKIIEFAKTSASTIKRDPVNAIFKFENNQVLEFRPASPGISLDPQKMANLIESEYAKLLNTTDKTITLTLPVDKVPPSLLTQDVNNLGIKELLGRGVSTFKHSTAIRNMNVERGAAIVNRILVAPGEEFSFIKSLGEVTLENGFKKAYIIRAGKTELDVGGGICQVSTTFFRAMLNAGVNITARQNHAYRVSYYEEDMPPGYDATVFIPNPDLKFINDTSHYILIQNTYDGVNKKLVYEIYGTSDGRQVDITNYRKWDATPAPPDRWIDDPTLPPGKVIQDEHAIPGLKTAFDWKVVRNGEVIHQKTFQSNFVPWAAVYRRGPSL